MEACCKTIMSAIIPFFLLSSLLCNNDALHAGLINKYNWWNGVLIMLL